MGGGWRVRRSAARDWRLPVPFVPRRKGGAIRTPNVRHAFMIAPLRLRLDSAALAANWRVLDAMSGRAACGAAIKADGYGLGAAGVGQRLADAGCRAFLVATWAIGRAAGGERVGQWG